jgi:predicted HicB family RNase H-like nuclease
MEYKGYFGSAEVDVEGNALVGKLLFMRDVITYSATTPKGLQKAFREAVDDYLETCRELGNEPDTPCKGTFNVRIGPELHRQVALIARSKGMGLNEFVRDALAAAIQPSRQLVEHQHNHRHEVVVHVEHQDHLVVSPSQDATWRSYGTH